MKELGRKTLCIDSRKMSSCLISGSLTVGVLGIALVSIAMAASVPVSNEAVKVDSLVQLQWWLLGGMFTLVGILISFIVVREWNSTKQNIRELWKEKLGAKEHGELDHSHLCAFCRDKKVKTTEG